MARIGEVTGIFFAFCISLLSLQIVSSGMYALLSQNYTQSDCPWILQYLFETTESLEILKRFARKNRSRKMLTYLVIQTSRINTRKLLRFYFLALNRKIYKN